MQEIILASNNEHKLKEIKQILSGFNVVSLKEAGIDIDVVEDGKTFAENAEKKARTITELTGKIAMADDSGICVEALDNAPGVFSARYSETGNDDDNNDLLLKNMQGITNRKAYFECDIVITYPNGEKVLEVGKWYGKIAEEKRGSNGFGYDVLFMPDEFPDNTSAEIDPQQKNAISHRAKALHKIVERLEN